MAEHTFSLNGDIEFKGTYRELDTFVEAVERLRPVFEAQEIEGPVRVGDTIEITEAKSRFYTEGKRYVVDKVNLSGDPVVTDDEGDPNAVASSKYRIVARKKETPQPAKPSVKVGEHIVFDEGNEYITAGKAYKVVDIDSFDDPVVVDNDGDEISAGGSAPEEYRVITDARELSFAKAGRKLDEFKAGDIVGSEGRLRIVEEVAPERLTLVGGNIRNRGRCHLVAPVDSRVDAYV